MDLEQFYGDEDQNTATLVHDSSMQKLFSLDTNGKQKANSRRRLLKRTGSSSSRQVELVSVENRIRDPFNVLAIKFAVAYIDRNQFWLNDVRKEWINQENYEGVELKVLEMRQEFKTIDDLIDANLSTKILDIMEVGLRSAVSSNHEVAI